MKKLKLFFALIIAFIVPLTSFGQMFDPVHWSFSTESLGNNEYNVIFKADIDAGWHVYSQNIADGGPVPTTFYFAESSDYQRLGEVTEGEAIVLHDPVFDMELRFFEKEAIFIQKVKVLGKEPVAVKGELEYMVCNDGQCLPPTPVEFDINLDNGAITNADAEKEAGDSLLSMILQAILWGLAALLTPCVFPMIPMTVSFFLHGSENKAAGRFKAIMYFIFIVLLYTLPIAIIIMVTWIFGGDSVTGDIFNWLSTHWLPNIIFFLVFMVFAASFFGAFEIVLPSSLVNKSDANSEKKGLAGVFFMALTLVLVSFACTGPIVGTVLIKSTSGEFWTPILTMFCYACTFALPFALFALFPSMLKNLPKSGGSSMNVQVAQSTTRATSSSSTSCVSLTCSTAGTYDIYWSCFRSSTGGTSGSQLYIGGSAYGTENTSFTNHIQNNHLTGVTLAKNQTVAVYARSRGSNYYAYVGTLVIKQTA